MRVPKFDYFVPKTLEEALSLLSELGAGAYVVAGGTDVMTKMTHGKLMPKALISLCNIEHIDEIRYDAKEGLTIGATVRLAEAAAHPDILNHYPSIAQAILSMATVEVRNMGTVAGNICNAAPSADTAPPLITAGAEVTLMSLQGERRLSLDKFFTGPGFTAMEQGEIMTSIHVPVLPAKSGTSYKRISARCGVDIAAVGVGVTAVFNGRACTSVCIVLGSVAPVPMRAINTEALMQGGEWTPELIWKGGELAAEEARPISDVRATTEWRRQMVAVLTRRALEEAHERAMQAKP